MEFLSFLALIGTVLTLLAYPTQALSDPSCPKSPASSEIDNKLRLTGAEFLEVNKNYITDGLIRSEVIPVNQSYTRLSVEYSLAKNLPMDIIYSGQVYRTKASIENYEKIRDYSLYICKDFCSPYFIYMPDAIIDIVKKGQCLPKDLNYSTGDQRYFKFFDLLTTQELTETQYFLLANTISYKNEVILRYNLYFITQLP